MKVFIKTFDKRDVVIDVMTENTIRIVKEKVRNILRIPAVDALEFKYQEIILDENKTLEECGIKEGSIINVRREKDRIELFGKTLDGKTVAFKVDKSESIQNMKEKIREKTGLSADEQKLMYQGAILDEEKSVEDYQIGDKAVINVVARLRGEMVLFVKTMDGKIVACEVLKSDSIQNMKEKIKEKTGLDVDDQKLVYQGAILEDGKTVGDYQIGDKDVINVVIRWSAEWDICLSYHFGEPHVVEEISKYLTNQQYKATKSTRVGKIKEIKFTKPR